MRLISPCPTDPRSRSASHVLSLLCVLPPPSPAAVPTPRGLSLRRRDAPPLSSPLPPPPPPRWHRAPPRRRRDPPLHLLPPPGATGRASRLYACLVCTSVSCHAHAPNHAALRPGHEIALDVNHAELFCVVCCDRAVIGWKSSPLLVQEGNASSTTTMGGRGRGGGDFFFFFPSRGLATVVDVARPRWEGEGETDFFLPFPWPGHHGQVTASHQPATTGRGRGWRREGEGVGGGGRNRFFFALFVAWPASSSMALVGASAGMAPAVAGKMGGEGGRGWGLTQK